MLCPEVWTFQSPLSNTKQNTGFYQTTDGINYPPTLDQFYYAHFVSVVLPFSKLGANLLDELASDCDYYQIDKLSIAEFVRKDFIENFVKRGQLTALSINTRLDTDNCVAITPEGVLVLSLNKQTFQELGLEGKVSHFSSRKKEKYIVHIDLADDQFIKNTKLYERTRQCLAERLDKFSLIFSWEPPEPSVCPSSIAKYLSDTGLGVFLCKPKCQTQIHTDIKTPLLNEDLNGSELVEWLGMLTLGCDLTEGAFDSYLNTYETPDDNVTTKLVSCELRGLFTVSQIRKIYEKITKHAPSCSPWSSLYVQGFSDAPVCWKLQENHYYTNADNAYTLFLQPNGKYLLCTHSTTNKRHK